MALIEHVQEVHENTFVREENINQNVLDIATLYSLQPLANFFDSIEEIKPIYQLYQALDNYDLDQFTQSYSSLNRDWQWDNRYIEENGCTFDELLFRKFQASLNRSEFSSEVLEFYRNVFCVTNPTTDSAINFLQDVASNTSDYSIKGAFFQSILLFCERCDSEAILQTALNWKNSAESPLTLCFFEDEPLRLESTIGFFLLDTLLEAWMDEENDYNTQIEESVLPLLPKNLMQLEMTRQFEGSFLGKEPHNLQSAFELHLTKLAFLSSMFCDPNVAEADASSLEEVLDQAIAFLQKCGFDYSKAFKEKLHAIELFSKFSPIRIADISPQQHAKEYRKALLTYPALAKKCLIGEEYQADICYCLDRSERLFLENKPISEEIVHFSEKIYCSDMDVNDPSSLLREPLQLRDAIDAMPSSVQFDFLMGILYIDSIYFNEEPPFEHLDLANVLIKYGSSDIKTTAYQKAFQSNDEKALEVLTAFGLDYTME